MFLDNDSVYSDFGDCFEESGRIGWVCTVGCHDFDSFRVDTGGVCWWDCDSGFGGVGGGGVGDWVVVFVVCVISPSFLCCWCHCY